MVGAAAAQCCPAPAEEFADDLQADSIPIEVQRPLQVANVQGNVSEFSHIRRSATCAADQRRRPSGAQDTPPRSPARARPERRFRQDVRNVRKTRL